MSDEVFYLLDHASAGYLFMSALFIYLIGRRIRNDVPMLSVWQTVIGSAVFVMLLVRRLFIHVPYGGGEITDALFRAAAFGAMTFGIAGCIGTIVLALYRSWQLVFYKTKSFGFGVKRFWDARRPAPKPVAPTAAELRRMASEDQRRREQREQYHAENQRREELKMQLELDIEFATDKMRRERVDEFIDKYANQTLTLNEYERRLNAIREAALRDTRKTTRHYESIQEIITDYQQQFDDIEKSINTEFEKEMLRALLEQERQTALQRFIQQ